MDEIDVKLKDYKDTTWIDKEHSNSNEIYIILELDPSKYKLTETSKVDRIEELKDYYDKITKDMKSNF
ncbi:hypothetical protein [Methanobacterium oryzae]|uniref:hypothetical protein n=1 Tax=Methanobacterium oryzae TaxID=69540 RepID=UPI003D1CDF5B